MNTIDIMQENEFSINANTFTLKNNSQKNGRVILDESTKYVVPIYQRPYSWNEEQIGKFFSDIFLSYWDKDGNVVKEPMFIGTMQLSVKNEANKQEVIDGQQRLTTFLLFFKVLKERFSASEKVKSIPLNFLSTRVNNGSQQRFLEKIATTTLLNDQDLEEEQNPYLKNLFLIDRVFNNLITEADGLSKNFNIDSFVDYLLSNIYFVVIETRAGLSKTLQIFDAINTTGLDLSGADVFKIRMFEYLTSIKGEREEVFEEINELYKNIADNNLEVKMQYTSIDDILGIYQYILIAKNNLPSSLYYLGVTTFYERLFNTLLNINQWEGFKNNITNIELSLNEIQGIIDVRHTWEKRWQEKKYFSVVDVCSMHFIWGSRYSRYWNLVFVFLYIHKNDLKVWEKHLFFNSQLSKLFVIYSVRFQRIISEIYYRLMQTVIGAIVNGDIEQVMNLINSEIDNKEKHNSELNPLNYFLTENLVENYKRKIMVCRLSAMLYEDYNSIDSNKIKEIEKKLFEEPIDIEHIQPYLDSKIEERENILLQWGDKIDSLGNLIILERSTNRSISNGHYEDKIKQYKESSFQIVKEQSNQYPSWNSDQSVIRKDRELGRILQYLFSST